MVQSSHASPEGKRGWLGKALIFLGLLALPACQTTVMSQHERARGLDRAQWSIVPQEEAWMNVPEASMVLERRFADVVEQRVSLPNQTMLAGDNYVHVRAVPPSDSRIFEIERALELVGGLPAPFTAEEIRVMHSREDSAGAINWTEWTDGAGNTCVLALRRLGPSVRVMPGRAHAMDVIVRNCSADGVEAALRPAGPSAVTLPAAHGAAPGGDILTISPLAAPMP